MQKKGLTPVIATMLLISIALAIAVIIFFWARSFLNDQNIKFDEPIESACADVDFDIEITTSGNDAFVDITNRGGVPIYGLEIRKRGTASIESSVSVLNNKAVGTTSKCTVGICNGESGRVTLSNKGIAPGNILVISPVLMGTKAEVPTSYGCQGEKHEQEITAK